MDKSDQDKIRLAKGPFGLLTARHALLFGKAAFFGLPPKFTKRDAVVNNGTVTFVDLGKGPIGITCAHVLAGYRELFEFDRRTIFQIGHFDFDPLKYLIAEDKDLDLATIDLGEGRLEKILTRVPPGSQCYRPPCWPPREVKSGDVVASLGGFPGLMRRQLAADSIQFNAYSHSGARVDSVSDRHFICQFEREFWVTPSSPEESRAFNDYGGMSGGPVFIDRGLHFEFVGVVKEFSSTFDLMYVGLARHIRNDGTIIDCGGDFRAG